MKSKTIQRCIGVLAVCSLLAFGVRFAVIGWQNRYVASFYVVDANISPYEAGTPIEEIDMRNLYAKYVGTDRAYVYIPTKYRTFQLPCDLTYWKMEDEKYTPAFTLKSGTTVLNLDQDAFVYPGYGYISFPTYSADWRYVIPFVVEGEPSSDPPIYGINDPRVEGIPFCYVRTEELCRVVYHALVLETDGEVEEPEYRREQEKRNKEQGKLSPIEYNFYFRTDYMLRDTGVYLSPNLQAPYFDAANIILLSSAGVLLAVYIVLRVRKRKT